MNKVVLKNGIKYIIKPKVGVVIGLCEMKDSGINKHNIPQIDCTVIDWYERICDCHCGRTIKAVAKCNADDIFDERFGMKLVEAKINKKKHEVVLKNIAYIMGRMESVYNKLSRSYVIHKNKMNNIDTDLRNYFGLGSD